jgi:hypothetical protein
MPSGPVAARGRRRAALGTLRVQAEPCSTCVYRKETLLDPDALDDRVRDPYGGFNGYRICHHSDDACCRGFWNRHKDGFAAGQIAQRLGLVEYVNDDNPISIEDGDA